MYFQVVNVSTVTLSKISFRHLLLVTRYFKVTQLSPWFSFCLEKHSQPDILASVLLDL